MYLIYVCAHQRSSDDEPSSEDLPQDLQPIMLALNCDKEEYLLREATTRRRKMPKPEGFEDVERIFVKLKETESLEDDDSESISEVLDAGKAQLAIALATVYFDKGSHKPINTDFSKYVCERSRVADRVVVAGYTDKNCSVLASEKLAMERAFAVRKILKKGGLKCPVVAISRPATAHAKEARWSRRAQIAALFFSNKDDNGRSASGGKPPGGKAKKINSGSSSVGRKKQSKKKSKAPVAEPVAMAELKDRDSLAEMHSVAACEETVS